MLDILWTKTGRIPDMKIHIASAFVLGLLFAVIGRGLPMLASKYMPPEYYYNVQYMDIVSTDIKPCRLVEYSIHRKSIITTEATLHRKLVRISPTQLITEKETNISISAREPETIRGSFALPCELLSGQYVFENVVYFEVDGFEKAVWYRSNIFEVEK